MTRFESSLNSILHVLHALHGGLLSGISDANKEFISKLKSLEPQSPQAPIHIFIVPNKEIPTVNDMRVEDEQLVGHMFTVAQQIALREGIAEDGYRLLVNCNKNVGQIVFHLHMHMFAGRPLGPMIVR